MFHINLMTNMMVMLQYQCVQWRRNPQRPRPQQETHSGLTLSHSSFRSSYTDIYKSSNSSSITRLLGCRQQRPPPPPTPVSSYSDCCTINSLAVRVTGHQRESCLDLRRYRSTHRDNRSVLVFF